LRQGVDLKFYGIPISIKS